MLVRRPRRKFTKSGLDRQEKLPTFARQGVTRRRSLRLHERRGTLIAPMRQTQAALVSHAAALLPPVGVSYNGGVPDAYRDRVCPRWQKS
jgi:hypothetical protein